MLSTSLGKEDPVHLSSSSQLATVFRASAQPIEFPEYVNQIFQPGGSRYEPDPAAPGLKFSRTMQYIDVNKKLITDHKS